MRTAPRLAWVTDPPALRQPAASLAAAACAGGVDLVHVRWSGAPDGALLTLSLDVVRAVAATGARVVVNDRVDVALAAGASGVHLRSTGLLAADAREVARRARGDAAAGALLVGRSLHSATELAQADADGDLDYCMVGPLHATGGKPPLGLAGLARLLDEARVLRGGALRIPWMVLGGVSEDDVRAVGGLARPGERWGLAAVRLFQEATDPEGVARRVAAAMRAADSIRA